MVITGKAIGGPRDGAKLTAPPNWNGRVAVPGGDTSKVRREYPGHYEWVWPNWVWQPDPDPKIGVCTCDAKIYRDSNRRWRHYNTNIKSHVPTPKADIL